MEASRHTVAGYRDTFRLLLRFASSRCGKPPHEADDRRPRRRSVADFLITETARGNTARSRNTRLAAIRSFFRYVAIDRPELASSLPAHSLDAQQALRKAERDLPRREEIAALLAAPDRTTWVGRRDHALLLLALQTGLRASELINLRCKDVVLGTGAHIRCIGKGRKERCTPLRRDTAKLLAGLDRRPP